jgi:uncharacterized damage-inducible protein DinB
MASTAIVRDLLLYMLWADRLMLKAVREVSPEDLTRDAGISFGSMLGTMVHMLGSQRLWLARFSGTSLDRRPTLQDLPDLSSWVHGWEETAAGIEAFLAALTEEQLAAEIVWEDSDLGPVARPLWQPVTHMVNHNTYHRGQVVSLLRQLGHEAPKTDFIYFQLKK